jgi:HAE1 family hydrophobic/amphiphilic exporter-1
MMPLVLAPGAGSELYRGLGAVIVGGLLLSTFFTLVLTPVLLSMLMDIKAAIAGRESLAGSGGVLQDRQETTEG